MNNYPSRETISYLRRKYPKGTRVELVEMKDLHGPPIGTKGSVRYVDDIGNIHMKWDNGSGISMVYGVDEFKKIRE